MARCAYRVYTIDGPMDAEKPLTAQMREVRCEDDATQTYVYTVPRLIDVHGESEEVCALHAVTQREIEDVHRYLATPQGVADIFGDKG